MACSNYPECKTIKSTKVKEAPVPTGEDCPECGKPLVQRKSRFGTTFVGCSAYPKCRYIKKDPKAEEAKKEAKAKKETEKKAKAKKTVKKTTKKKEVSE